MQNKRSAHVIVLGDLKRSPRITSHARFLAEEGFEVKVSGYGSHEMDSKYENLKWLEISQSPDFKSFVYPAFLALIFKFIYSAICLLLHLIFHCRGQIILVQNPPSVPTFIVIWAFLKVTGRKLVVDWHNYGYTLLSYKTSHNGLSSRLYRILEQDFAAKFLNQNSQENKIEHMCVSRALQHDLHARSIEATVVYDRPPDTFCPSSSSEAHDLFKTLSSEYPVLADLEGSVRRTRFTELVTLPDNKGGAFWRRDRPALVVSSCSWTEDDDFGMMLDALDMYNKRASLPDSNLPRMLLAVTGRGPLRAHYLEVIESKSWTHVEVIMPWLEWEKYPSFLGCADLGISLHNSSSGLDLPMKLVDLIGVEVPVVALSYPTLYELLPENQIGLHFHNTEQLIDQLCSLLQPADPEPDSDAYAGRFRAVGSAQLKAFRDNLKLHTEHTLRGRAYWRSVALPVFNRLIRS